MKKIFSIFLIIIGIGIIVTGIYLQIDKNSENVNKEDKQEPKKDTFVELNPHNLESTCTNYNKISTYLNTSDYKKISFDYPDCLHEYDLSFWYKSLASENDDIKMKVYIEKDTISNYLNSEKTNIISKKNNTMYQNVQYSEITSEKINDQLTISVLQHSYQMNLYPAPITYDVWNIALPIDQNNILVSEITTKDKIMTYATIKDIFSNMKIEDNAIFKNSTPVDDYQIGTLKQNKPDSFEHGYKVTYRVPNKYPEVDALSSNYDTSIFLYEDINQKNYISIELVNEQYNTLQEEIESIKEATLKTYDFADTYRNYKNNAILQKNINSKNVSYFIDSYDYYLNNKKSHTAYISYIYYPIAPNFFYKVYINTTSVEITEKYIATFLNFEVEEY